MKVVLQRVKKASVRVRGEVVGAIEKGLLLLVGFSHHDDKDVILPMAKKIVSLRIFPDEEGKMNLSLREVSGSILSVSQFTLYGDVSKGRRPSFVAAAPSDKADRMYGIFNDALRKEGVPLEMGIFGEEMEVSLVNDGPITLVIEDK